MTHTRTLRYVGLAAAAAAAVLLTACSGSSSSSSASQPDRSTRSILNVAAADAVTTWDPVASFSTEVAYMANIYETLLYAVKSNPDGTVTFKPGLATSWTHSADGRTWTFKLRPNVTFHDGEPLTASAVKDSFEAAAKSGGAAFIWADLASIETPSTDTVVIKMKDPQPVDLIASSEYGAYVVSPKGLAARAKDPKYFDEKLVDAGTGPYTLASYVSGKQVVLKEYDNYWGGWKGRHYSTINITITSEAVVRQQELESGQVQYAESPPLHNIAQISKNFNVKAYPTSFSYVGFLNTTRPPLNNVKVRQALSYATPYKNIVDVGASGYGTQARGAVPDGIFPYSGSVPQYHQDLAKAKQLLAEAGHPGGGFTLNLTYAAENPGEAAFAPLLKDAFAKIGVTLNIKAILFNQQWEQAKADPAKAQDIFLLLYWPTYADAGSDNLHTMFHSSDKPYFNLSYWNDKAYDNLIDQALSLTQTDRNKALSLYVQAQKQLVDQAPALFFYTSKDVVATARSVAGLDKNLNYPFVTFYYSAHPLSS